MKMKKLLALLTAALLLTGLVSFAATAEETVDLTGHIVILHTNDVCGCADTHLGYTRVAVAKERLERAGATVLLLDAGNALYGRPFATSDRGESIIQIMNKIGYDAMTPGGRDLTYGRARLAELAELADFPMISANLMTDDGADMLPGTAIVEKGNVKFGIFGITLAEGGSYSGLTVENPISRAAAQVSALEAENCTIIIGLTNAQADGDGETTCRTIAGQIDGVDLIIGGGEATEGGLWAGSTLIASAGEGLRSIGCIDIDPEGYASATLLTDEDFSEADVDIEVSALISQIAAGQDELLSAVIGQSKVPLEGASEAVCSGESNLGNLVADALRSMTGAEIALVRGGDIRASVPAGDVTKKQLTEVLPLGHSVVTVSVTGEQLIAALENGVSLYPAADERFPQVSGLSFRFDPDQPVGSRVFDVKVGGEPVDTAKTYSLAACDDSLSGDDCPLADAPVTGRFGAANELLISYVSSFETPIAAEIEGRSAPESKPAA